MRAGDTYQVALRHEVVGLVDQVLRLPLGLDTESVVVVRVIARCSLA